MCLAVAQIEQTHPRLPRLSRLEAPAAMQRLTPDVRSSMGRGTGHVRWMCCSQPLVEIEMEDGSAEMLRMGKHIMWAGGPDDDLHRILSGEAGF